MNRIRANGLDFAYVEQGDGPLVILLHGFPDTAHSWNHQIPALAAALFETTEVTVASELDCALWPPPGTVVAVALLLICTPRRAVGPMCTLSVVLPRQI